MSVVDGLQQQDDPLPEFTVNLATFLAVMRILAGRRGHSRVAFWAGGFQYDLHVTRRPQTRSLSDFDENALGYAEARQNLHDYLNP